MSEQSVVAATLGETNLALYRIAAIHGRIADALEILGGVMADEPEYERDSDQRRRGKDVNVRLDCHFHIHGDSHVGDRLERIEALLQTILQKENTIMANIDDILSSVTELPTINDSLDALFVKLADLIRAGGGDPAKMQQALDLLTGSKQRTKDAIVANTPVEQPPPPA